ncbi:unnamed protein product, partial [Mesorhabditis spiculigera]
MLVFLALIFTTSFAFCPLDSERDSSGEYCYSVCPYKWTHIQAMAHCKNFAQADASIHNAFDNVALGPPCDDEWLYSAKLKSCYKRIGNFSGITWQQARAECQAFGADLTSIHSDEENRIVVELADTYLDIQLNYANWTTAATWIGGYRTGPKATDFAWTDGSKFDYTHWAYTEPDNKDGQQPHVHVSDNQNGLGFDDAPEPVQ